MDLLMGCVCSVQERAESFSGETSVSTATKLFPVTVLGTVPKFSDTVKAESFAHFKYFN